MSTASDNTAKWAVRKFGGAGLPVGFEYFTTNPNIPAGSLPLLGGVYSRTLYKDLWNWVQEQTGYLIEESVWQEKSAANEGNVPFYSTGDGTTTFRVPSLKCWVKGANGIEEVGSYLSAGLPNITGEVHSADWGSWNDPVGGLGDSALYYPYNSNTHGPGSGGTAQKNHGVAIDASRSNSIYGNSDTVQPKSIVGMWLVKAYGTVTNVGNTDVAAIAQGLTELETRVTPISDMVIEVADYIIESYRNGTEWYEVYKSGKVRQGGKKPANNTQITFLKPFANTNYYVSSTGIRSSATDSAYHWVHSLTTTGFTSLIVDEPAPWVAEGQGA